MHDLERFRLRYGPYRTPRFRYGTFVQDARRGEVKIVGLTDAPIPWPIGQKGSVRTLVLFGALVKAVRRESNQAVALAWGVSGQTVHRLAESAQRSRDDRRYARVAFGSLSPNMADADAS